MRMMTRKQLRLPPSVVATTVIGKGFQSWKWIVEREEFLGFDKHAYKLYRYARRLSQRSRETSEVAEGTRMLMFAVRMRIRAQHLLNISQERY